MVYILKRQFSGRVKFFRALTSTYGIGMARAKKLSMRYGLLLRVKVANVRRRKISKLNRYVARKYVIGKDLRRRALRAVKIHKRIGSYKGLRFRQGLPANGQRTRSNANTCRRFKSKKKKTVLKKKKVAVKKKKK